MNIKFLVTIVVGGLFLIYSKSSPKIIPKPLENPTLKSLSFVVSAHSDTDYQWLNFKGLQHVDKFYIYEKTENSSMNKLLNIQKRVTFKNVKNVGREAETYLTHIINHYDTLEDIMVFTQAHWSRDDHAPWLAWYIQPDLYQQYSFKYLSNHPCYRLIPNYSEKPSLGPLIVNFWDKVYDTPFPELVTWQPKGIFVTRKEQILLRSKQWWMRLRELLLNDPSSPDDSNMLHWLERTWHIHLGCNPDVRGYSCDLTQHTLPNFCTMDLKKFPKLYYQQLVGL